ncbi:MAG TPA: hypothetical protein VGF81_15530 [Solirubrobacteraceae bacterium]|jgi:hypothetical protein
MFKSPKKLLAAGGALATLGLGGAAIADAATTSTPATTTTPGSGARPGFPAPGSATHEGAEKAVTGAAASKAQAAAVKSVGSGTAGAVTTDFNGNGYEVTVTKSDGTKVEVNLDSSFNVERGGPGRGCAGGPGGHRGPPPAGAGSGSPPSGSPSSGYGSPPSSSGAPPSTSTTPPSTSTTPPSSSTT